MTRARLLCALAAHAAPARHNAAPARAAPPRSSRSCIPLRTSDSGHAAWCTWQCKLADCLERRLRVAAHERAHAQPALLRGGSVARGLTALDRAPPDGGLILSDELTLSAPAVRLAAAQMTCFDPVDERIQERALILTPHPSALHNSDPSPTLPNFPACTLLPPGLPPPTPPPTPPANDPRTQHPGSVVVARSIYHRSCSRSSYVHS